MNGRHHSSSMTFSLLHLSLLSSSVLCSVFVSSVLGSFDWMSVNIKDMVVEGSHSGTCLRVRMLRHRNAYVIVMISGIRLFRYSEVRTSAVSTNFRVRILRHTLSCLNLVELYFKCIYL